MFDELDGMEHADALALVQTRLGAVAESKPLPPGAQRVYDYIIRHAKEHGRLPSIREIGQGLGLRSTQTVWRHMQVIADRGMLQRDSYERRYTIRGEARCPCCGQTIKQEGAEEAPEDDGRSI